MVMDLEGEMTVVPMPTQSSNYLHESSATKQQQQQQQQQLNKIMSASSHPSIISVEDHTETGGVVSGVVPGGGYDTSAAAAAAAAATASAVAAAAAAVAATMGNNGTMVTTPSTNGNNNGTSKKPVRYRECQKNHAAGIGGHALDGCGEFLPSGEEGSIESLKCSACDCHRNFHRREVEGAVTATTNGKKRGPSLLSPLAAITPGSSSRSPASLLSLGSDQTSEDGQDGQAPHGFSLSHHMNPSVCRQAGLEDSKARRCRGSAVLCRRRCQEARPQGVDAQ